MKPKMVTEDAVKAALLKQLEQELLEHNDFFDMVVDMIPSKLYVAGKSGDDFNPKYFKGQSDTRKAAAKAAKRQKLDPSEAKSTKEVNTDGATGDVPAAKPVEFTPGQSRIEALRAKLHAKIASKQQRPAGSSGNPEAISKRAARKQEKERRKAEAKKRKKAATTATNPSNKNTSYTITPTTPSDPMQDLQHVDFGLISGLNSDKSKSNYLQTNKALSSKGKNLHKILADAEAKQKKLQALKNSTDEKDKQKAAAMQWSDTFKEADGVRVKDDPTKLRKMVKRKEVKKQKSQKAWKGRMEQQSEKAKNRQQIRQHNLTQRKQGGAAGANLSKKKIVDETEKEGGGGRQQRRPGFEGRKQGFLNSPRERVMTAAGGGKKKKQQ